MEIKVCKRCKKMFQYIAGRTICPACIKNEEDIFIKVKEYLRENRGADMNTVCEETGATTAMIQMFLREGRLEVATGSPLSMNCEHCGETISKGRYCEKCQKELQDSFSKVASTMAKKDDEKVIKKNRMHFLNSQKK
ncbi:MAG: hypothetical protein ACRCSG_02555 [Cellulosilyticaceae bacterium]